MLSLDRTVDWKHMLHIHSIIFNIDVVQHHLNTIFESIQLAKLGVISKAFLQPSELNFATNLLESQGIAISSYDQTYEFLEPMAFHNGSSIVFVIKIPKLRKGAYKQLRIEPIPIRNRIIDLNATKAIVSSNESYLIVYPCTNIETNYICNVENLFNISDDNCLHPILRGFPSNCTFVKFQTQPEMKVIESLGLLIKNSVKPTLLQNDCGFGPRNLTGTILIKFENCIISLNGKQFANKIFRGETSPKILPILSTHVEEAALKTESMTKIEEMHINNRQKLKHLESMHQRTNTLNIGTTLLITSIVIAILILMRKEVRNLKLRFMIQVPANNDENASQTELNRDGSN